MEGTTTRRKETRQMTTTNAQEEKQMKNTRIQTLGKLAIAIGFTVGLGMGTPSLATADSLADTPVPILQGTTKSAQHIYSVTGVQNSGASTAFHCTSTEKTGGKDIVWGVEIFENTRLENDVTNGEGVSVLSPGETNIITTGFTPPFSGAVIPSLFEVFHGSARILATSNKIICAAFLVDALNNPPTFMTTLPVFKRTTQKGQ